MASNTSLGHPPAINTITLGFVISGVAFRAFIAQILTSGGSITAILGAGRIAAYQGMFSLGVLAVTIPLFRGGCVGDSCHEPQNHKGGCNDLNLAGTF